MFKSCIPVLLSLAAAALGATASAAKPFGIDKVLAEQFPPSTGPFMGDWPGKWSAQEDKDPFLPTDFYKDRIKPQPKNPDSFELQAHNNHVEYRNIWILEKQ